MDLLRLSQTLQQDAVTIVFLNVLLQQLGLPVPAMPTLLLAGSLAATPGRARLMRRGRRLRGHSRAATIHPDA